MDRHFNNLIYIWIIFTVIVMFMMSCKTKKGASNDYSDQNIKLIVDTLDSKMQKWEPDNDFEKKGIIVRINPKLYGSKFLKEGKTIDFNFSPKDSLKGKIDKVNIIINGKVISIYGSLIKPNKGYFTISIDGRKIVGEIVSTSSKKDYRIFYSSTNNSHVVTEIDRSLLDFKEDSVLIPPSDSANNNNN